MPVVWSTEEILALLQTARQFNYSHWADVSHYLKNHLCLGAADKLKYSLQMCEQKFYDLLEQKRVQMPHLSEKQLAVQLEVEYFHLRFRELAPMLLAKHHIFQILKKFIVCESQGSDFSSLSSAEVKLMRRVHRAFNEPDKLGKALNLPSLPNHEEEDMKLRNLIEQLRTPCVHLTPEEKRDTSQYRLVPVYSQEDLASLLEGLSLPNDLARGTEDGSIVCPRLNGIASTGAEHKSLFPNYDFSQFSIHTLGSFHDRQVNLPPVSESTSSPVASTQTSPARNHTTPSRNVSQTSSPRTPASAIYSLIANLCKSPTNMSFQCRSSPQEATSGPQTPNRQATSVVVKDETPLSWSPPSLVSSTRFVTQQSKSLEPVESGVDDLLCGGVASDEDRSEPGGRIASTDEETLSTHSHGSTQVAVTSKNLSPKQEKMSLRTTPPTSPSVQRALRSPTSSGGGPYHRHEVEMSPPILTSVLPLIPESTSSSNVRAELADLQRRRGRRKRAVPEEAASTVSSTSSSKGPSVILSSPPRTLEEKCGEATSPTSEPKARKRQRMGSSDDLLQEGPVESSLQQSVEIGCEAHRRWKKQIMQALQNCFNMKHSYTFNRPVQDDIAPNYSTMVKRPMDLGTLRKLVDQDAVTNTDTFLLHFGRIFANACMYNALDSEVYLAAIETFTLSIPQLTPLTIGSQIELPMCTSLRGSQHSSVIEDRFFLPKKNPVKKVEK